MMKAVTAKMLISLAAVLLAAPFFAVALLVGARAVAPSQGAQEDLLLVALALGGVAAGIVNGMGRRAAREQEVGGDQATAADNLRTRAASVLHLGY